MNEDNLDPASESHETRHSSVGNNPAEAILEFIVYVFLVFGIIASVVPGILLIMDGDSSDVKLGLTILIGGPIVSLIIWAAGMILINISNNIRQIKYELQDREW